MSSSVLQCCFSSIVADINITKFRLVNDFIVINLCDFSPFTSRVIFLRNRDVSRPRIQFRRVAMKKDGIADEMREGAGKSEEKRKLVMYFKRSM